MSSTKKCLWSPERNNEARHLGCNESHQVPVAKRQSWHRKDCHLVSLENLHRKQWKIGYGDGFPHMMDFVTTPTVNALFQRTPMGPGQLLNDLPMGSHSPCSPFIHANPNMPGDDDHMFSNALNTSSPPMMSSYQ